jgi:hypothetical protein
VHDEAELYVGALKATNARDTLTFHSAAVEADASDVDFTASQFSGNRVDSPNAESLIEGETNETNACKSQTKSLVESFRNDIDFKEQSAQIVSVTNIQTREIREVLVQNAKEPHHLSADRDGIRSVFNRNRDLRETYQITDRQADLSSLTILHKKKRTFCMMVR